MVKNHFRQAISPNEIKFLTPEFLHHVQGFSCVFVTTFENLKRPQNL
jgi:hypothetical protein